MESFEASSTSKTQKTCSGESPKPRKPAVENSQILTSLSVIFPFLIAIRIWFWLGYNKGFSFSEEVSQALLQIIAFKDDTDIFIKLENKKMKK